MSVLLVGAARVAYSDSASEHGPDSDGCSQPAQAAGWKGWNNGPSTAASSCLLIYSDPGYVFAELQPLSRCLRVTLPCSAGRDTIVSSDSTRGGHPFKPVNSRRSRDSLARQAHMPWPGVARALWQSLRFLQIFSAGQLQQNLGLAQRWRHVRTCTCTRDTELQLQFKLQT